MFVLIFSFFICFNLYCLIFICERLFNILTQYYYTYKVASVKTVFNVSDITITKMMTNMTENNFKESF